MYNYYDWLVAIVSLILSFVIYSFLGALDPALVMLINPFAVVVFFISILYGEVAGLLVGTGAGLIQDAFSYGVLGLAGLSYTISAFLAGWFSQKLNLNSFNKRFVFSFIFSLLQLSIWLVMYGLIFKQSILYSQPYIYIQPVNTALLVSVMVWLIKKLKLKGENA